MIQGTLISWDLAASLLANQDDEVQAVFFKAFAKEMESWPTHYMAEMQLHGVARKLTEDERNLLGCLCVELNADKDVG